MAFNITVTNKATHHTTTTAGSELSLSGLSIVQLQMPHSQIKGLARHGHDLVITTANGQVITVHGFFTDGTAAGHSDLVVQDHGGLWLGDLSTMDALPDTSVDPAAGGVFSSIDTTAPLFSNAAPVADTGNTPAADAANAAAADTSNAASNVAAAGSGGNLNWLPVAVALGSFSTAFDSSKSSSNSGFPVGPTVTQNTSGTLTVSGQVHPGDTVTVTYPDSSTSTGTADANGYYAVTSQGVQTTGNVSMADNSSAPIGQRWTDATPPQAPGVSTVTANADGTVTVSGKAEAGSTVTVTFADSSTATGTTDPTTGNYSVKSSKPETASGSVHVTATDAAGNHSAATTVAQVTESSAANNNGTLTVTGTAAPGSAITVTYADGNSATGTADSTTGNYSVQSKGAESGAVTVQAANTPPQAPQVNAIAAHADGTVTVSGTAKASSAVIVTFADGSQATGTADSSGHYSIQSSIPETSGGAVSVTATDALGNVSTSAAAIPAVTQSSTVNTDGTMTVSGAAAPDSTVAVTYADGSSATGTADASGHYSVQSSTHESGAVTVTATILEPQAPTISSATANSAGIVTVTGTATAGDTVTVSFPDGTSATGTADGTGHYSILSAAAVQASGEVTAIDSNASSSSSP
ncbi:MAG: Ig-like domain-containing protein, partial [Burkholderiaceae bacterium]|nr:Ig-like domain-containing protein [Burkholderiaceae bacterium]